MNNNASKEEKINQAIKFHLEGNIPKAAKCYQYCINQGFNNYRVFSNYGVILRSLGKFKEAELSTRKAIELNPNDAMAHSNLGSILKDIGKLQEAELSTRKAIELNPNDAIAHSNLGSILKDVGKLQDAKLSTQKAIELNPNDAMAHYNLGVIFKDVGNIQDAELSYRKAIELDSDLAEAHSNLGIILKDLGKLEEAELSYRKAIELKPNFAMAHSNLGIILKDLGKLEEAERSLRKAIEINSNLAGAYFSLSTLKYSTNNHKVWKDKLFSESILNSKSKRDQIFIYFAKSNILHKEKNYKESARNLQLANDLKLELKPSRHNILINKSKVLLNESDVKEINQKEYKKCPESIFIVGMPRSGTTLTESIICMNISVDDLGEVNILEESFVEHKTNHQGLTLAELYWKKINNNKTDLNITTNKWLYNYQYTGIICNQIPNAKIIHCFRNPLDNILSIYRTYFSSGYEYFSSLVDCAKIYLDQEEIMTQYKKRYRTKIYDLNYDLLVSNPAQEIKSLISWLGWEWKDQYLSPHLNPRAVSTASNIQVRSPINSKSIDGWKNYKKMLRPAMEILIKKDKFKNLKY